MKREVRRAAGGDLLASTADRERVVDTLKEAFLEGRLTEPELSERVGTALAARTYRDLGAVTADLPAGELAPPPSTTRKLAPVARAVPAASPARSRRRMNGLAYLAMVFAILAPFTAGATAIPAVVLGFLGLRQIWRTGEPGRGAAVFGLAVGLVALLFLTVHISV